MEVLKSQLSHNIETVGAFLSDFIGRVKSLGEGRITPDIILPSNLRTALATISAQLPNYLSLPKDYRTDLFEYYKFLTCQTILDKNRKVFYVLAKINLLDVRSRYDIFEVFSIPIVFPNSNLALSYDLDLQFLALSHDRAKYIPVDPSEIAHCFMPNVNFCDLRSAIYPVSAHASCVVSMFFQDVKRVQELCPVAWHADRQVHAVYLRNWEWQLSTGKAFTLNVICPDSDVHTRIYVKATLQSVFLKPGCYATSDYIELPPTFQQTSDLNLTLVRPHLYQELTQGFNISSALIWDSYAPLAKSLEKVHVPAELQKLPSMETADLFRELTEQEQRKSHSHNNSHLGWVLGLGGAVVTIVIVITIVIYIRIYRPYRARHLLKERKRMDIEAQLEELELKQLRHNVTRRSSRASRRSSRRASSRVEDEMAEAQPLPGPHTPHLPGHITRQSVTTKPS